MMGQSLTKQFIFIFMAAVLLCAPGRTAADTDRVGELEARVAELEALVHQLLADQYPAAVANGSEADAQAQDRVKAKTHGTATRQDGANEQGVRKHSYKFAGYVKADVLYSDFGGAPVEGTSAGRDFYVPATIPVGDSGETYLDLHAKESRINFGSKHLLDNGSQAGTFLELDFMLSAQGNEMISNSFSPRLRQAYFTYDRWLFGQTWMTFFNVSALPENLDFIGPSESTVFGRQAMIRYTRGPWQFSIENPETTITPFGGGERIVVDDNRVPDLVARYDLDRDWGNFTIAAILRELRCENGETGIKDSRGGYGVSLSGKISIGERDDFRWMASAGKGLGRYIGLNTANGAVLDGDSKLHAIGSSGMFGSYRHFWTQKWRSNLTLGYLSVDNDVTLTGLDVTREARSIHVNLIYTPQPRMDIGIEFLYADRQLESGNDGDLTRLQFSAKYAY